MYAKNKNYVTFFKDNNKENTDKIVYGRVSEAIKTKDNDENGKPIYEYETWNARFVGNALENAKGLTDKDVIILTEWACRVSYNKEKKQSFPYILVFGFESREKNDSVGVEGFSVANEDIPF